MCTYNYIVLKLGNPDEGIHMIILLQRRIINEVILNFILCFPLISLGSTESLPPYFFMLPKPCRGPKTMRAFA